MGDLDTSLIDKEYVKREFSDILNSVRSTLNYASKKYKDVFESEKTATKYHVIVVAEGISSIALHVVRKILESEGRRAKPETILEALAFLREWGVISEGDISDIREVIELRNILIFRYQPIDDREIFLSVKRNFPRIVGIAEKVCSFVGI